MKTNEKKCPFCDELIKSIAIICKHCKSDLTGKRQTREIEIEKCLFCGEEVEKNTIQCKHCNSNLPKNIFYKTILIKNSKDNTEINFKYNPNSKFSIRYTGRNYGEKVTALNLNRCLNCMQDGELIIEDYNEINSIVITRKDKEFFNLRLFLSENSGLYKVELNEEQTILVSEYFMNNDVRIVSSFDWVSIDESVSGLLSEATSILLTPKRKKILIIYLLWFFVLIGLYLFRQYRNN